MNKKIKEGNYEKLGVSYQQEWTYFTFCGEKDDQCFVVLVNKKDKTLHKIEVPGNYCLGSLYSIAIRDLEVQEYVYYFEINGKKVMDPCAHGVMGREIWNDSARKQSDYEVYGAFVPEEFDWGKSVCPELPSSRMILYKLHIRGFTMDSGRKHGPGTFAALADRILYLKKLGITTLELMPVYEFEEMEFPVQVQLPPYVKWKEKEEDVIHIPQVVKEALPKVNYWGYKTGNYFAVKSSYAAEPEHASREYKSLIRRLHENEMECVMEMYFPEDTNHNLILDVLRYWVREYHVDGFHLIGSNLPITAIVQDNILSRTKIFYESLDENTCSAGRKYKNLYVYKEEYMYPARRVLNHLNGNMRDFADQQRKQGAYLGYINYIASNNGFTLADLFMYNDKHNEANGENNSDGNAWNFSNNYGVEGPTKKRYINTIRKLKWRNSILMLFLAQGVPLLWEGDEMGNSQNGNNNAYCQDNPLGWLNWKNEKSHRKEINFLRQVIAFRKEHPIISNEMPFQFSDYKSVGCPDLSFHGESAWIMEPIAGRMSLGMMYCGAYAANPEEAEEAEDVYVAYNFSSAMTSLALPEASGKRRWYMVIDSSNDQTPFLEEPVLCTNGSIVIKSQTIQVFVSKKEKVKKHE